VYLQDVVKVVHLHDQAVTENRERNDFGEATTLWIGAALELSRLKRTPRQTTSALVYLETRCQPGLGLERPNNDEIGRHLDNAQVLSHENYIDCEPFRELSVSWNAFSLAVSIRDSSLQV